MRGFRDCLIVVPTVAQASKSTKIDLLGIGSVLIDVPRGVAVTPKGGFERVDFDIKRPAGKRIMRIVEQPQFDPKIVDFSTKPCCINGVTGVTTVRRGLRKTLLRLPPEGREYQFYFEFRVDDRTASEIMRSFRVKGLRTRC